jgi:hypothetical protein
LLVALAGCGGQPTRRSSDAGAPLTRPCDLKTLRLRGSFQGALGSQFGGVTISTAGKRTCQLRGGRPKVSMYVADFRNREPLARSRDRLL